MSDDYGLTYDHVSEKLHYVPETGKLFWKTSPARNVPKGSEAGCTKATRTGKNGKPVSYRYIRLDGRNIVASQIAWLLMHREWPRGRIGYKDGDPLNLVATNLTMSNFLERTEVEFDRAAYSRAHRETYPMENKDSELRSRFGINLAEYTALAVAQKGVCAICEKPETEERAGKLKALAVDHDHATGAVRGLLCQSCNKMIGLACDDVTVLAKAIRYLEKHSGSNVVAFPKEPA